MSLYIDQEIKVWSKTDNPPNGVIRVTFGEQTLSMSIIQASWLAALIQTEIHKVEQENPELTIPSDLERRLLKPGDTVKVQDDHGNEADYEVRTAPWQLGHGKWVIGLRGIAGGYSLDRVVKILAKETR